MKYLLTLFLLSFASFQVFAAGGAKVTYECEFGNECSIDYPGRAFFNNEDEGKDIDYDRENVRVFHENRARYEEGEGDVYAPNIQTPRRRGSGGSVN